MMIEEQQRELLDKIERDVQFATILNKPVTTMWWLLAANILIFAGFYIFGGMGLDPEFSTTFYRLNQIPSYTGFKVDSLIDDGQWWRLLSSMFVHMDIMHIGFNGYGLYVLGPLLEKFYGARRSFIIYMLAGLVGAAASYAFNDVPSAGASGAVYGLVGALAVVGFKFRTELPPQVARSFTVGMAPWVVLSIGIGFLDAIPFDNAAHIGGLLGGAIVTAFMGSRLARRRNVIGDWAVNALVVVLILISIWTAAEWSAELTNCLPGRDAFLQCYPEMTDRV